MQWSPTVLILGIRVCAFFDEEPYKIYMTLDRRLMQRGRPVFVLGCHVRAVVDKEPRELHVTIDRCPM